MFKTMIVDDMDIIRREMKRLKLWGEETGFTITAEAKNGHEAFEKLLNSPVDLVLTDIRMPKVDGIELLKKIMDEKLCTCVVLVSDHSEFNYARQGLVLGAFDYMVKPVDEKEFKKLLQRARDYIIDRKTEQEKLQQLQQSLTEKVETFFPQIENEQLVELMKANDARVREYADHIVDIVYSNLDNDLIKTESLLSRFIHELITKLQAHYNWLNKFIIDHELRIVGFTNFSDLDTLRVAFTSKIDYIANLLDKLNCGNDVNGVIGQVSKCVLENIDGDVSLKVVSEQIFMNRTYISETFKQKAGISFTEYLTIAKMERAKRLIADGRLKIYELAEMLGYKDIEYFSKLFKKYIGCSPTEYKNNLLPKSK